MNDQAVMKPLAEYEDAVEVSAKALGSQLVQRGCDLTDLRYSDYAEVLERHGQPIADLFKAWHAIILWRDARKRLAPRSGVTHEQTATVQSETTAGNLSSLALAATGLLASGESCLAPRDEPIASPRPTVGPVRVPGLDPRRIRSEELLHKTLSMLCHFVWYRQTRPGEHMWSIPVDKERDFDCILSDAIDELVELRRLRAGAPGVDLQALAFQIGAAIRREGTHTDVIARILAETWRPGMPIEPSDVEGEPAPIIPGRHPRPATILVGAPTSRTLSGDPE